MNGDIAKSSSLMCCHDLVGIDAGGTFFQSKERVLEELPNFMTSNLFINLRVFINL